MQHQLYEEKIVQQRFTIKLDILFLKARGGIGKAEREIKKFCTQEIRAMFREILHKNNVDRGILNVTRQILEYIKYVCYYWTN